MRIKYILMMWILLSGLLSFESGAESVPGKLLKGGGGSISVKSRDVTSLSGSSKSIYSGGYARGGSADITGNFSNFSSHTPTVHIGPAPKKTVIARTVQVSKAPVAKGRVADFRVDSNGTAIRNSASGARQDLKIGGFPGKATTQTLERGTLHRSVPGKDGPMTVRIMDGQANAGAFKGPRVRTTRSGSVNDGVRSDGSHFRNNESKRRRLRESHIGLGL